MEIHNINTFLLLFLLGLLSALFHYLILKKQFPGKLWSALIVGLLGSFLGYFFASLTIWPEMGWQRAFSLILALLFSQALLFLLGKISSVNDY